MEIELKAKAALFIGAYLSEEICDKRAILNRNIAASNRIMRLSSALASAGRYVTILSPGTGMRLTQGKRYWHPAYSEANGLTEVRYCAASGVPFLSAAVAPLFLLYETWRAIRSKKYGAVICYNYLPSIALVAFYSKYFARMPLVCNIEDISALSWKKLIGADRIRGSQQLLFWILMRAVCRSADLILCPSKRFIPFLGGRCPVEIVGGCTSTVEIKGEDTSSCTKTRILFSGLLCAEQGVPLMLQVISLLRDRPTLSHKLHIDICGGGCMAGEVRVAVDEAKSENMVFHGLLNKSAYIELLKKSHVCLALQDPAGENLEFKTPSKVYEYMSHGKCVIVSDVGDFAAMPESTRMILKPYTATRLCDMLGAITPIIALESGRNAHEYVAKYWHEHVVGPRLEKAIMSAIASREWG